MADIELVIKIPEEMYKWVYDVNKFSNDYGMGDFIDLIKNGTPLPKGHGRLIDVKQIVTEDECIWNSDGSCTTITTYDIDSTQTIIEADKETDDYYRGAQEEY